MKNTTSTSQLFFLIFSVFFIANGAFAASAQEKMTEEERILIQDAVHEYAVCISNYSPEKPSVMVNEVDEIASFCIRQRNYLQKIAPDLKLAQRIDNKMKRNALSANRTKPAANEDNE